VMDVLDEGESVMAEVEEINWLIVGGGWLFLPFCFYAGWANFSSSA
jgi:hypothetical protein